MRFFLWGALFMGCTTVAAHFVSHWRTTRDPLFAWFAGAFAIMGLNWLSLALVDPDAETRHILYLFRLAAFVLIILAIAQKNRRGARAGAPDSMRRLR